MVLREGYKNVYAGGGRLTFYMGVENVSKRRGLNKERVGEKQKGVVMSLKETMCMPLMFNVGKVQFNDSLVYLPYSHSFNFLYQKPLQNSLIFFTGLLSRTGLCPHPLNNLVVKDNRLNFYGVGYRIADSSRSSCSESECQGDEECQADRKCCVNRCGGRVCTVACMYF